MHPTAAKWKESAAYMEGNTTPPLGQLARSATDIHLVRPFGTKPHDEYEVVLAAGNQEMKPVIVPAAALLTYNAMRKAVLAFGIALFIEAIDEGPRRLAAEEWTYRLRSALSRKKMAS